jgi:hypothetical protein
MENKEYLLAILFIAFATALPALIVGITAEYIIKKLKK